MCTAIPIEAKQPNPINRWKGVEIPEGYRIVTPKLCKKCVYHSHYGGGDSMPCCLYAIRAGRCLTLEPEYIKGLCHRFKKGKAKREEWLNPPKLALREEV